MDRADGDATPRHLSNKKLTGAGVSMRRSGAPEEYFNSCRNESAEHSDEEVSHLLKMYGKLPYTSAVRTRWHSC
jgi:hypothetical protein